MLLDAPNELLQLAVNLTKQQLVDALPANYPMLHVIEALVNNTFSHSPFRIEELRANLATAGIQLSSDEYAKLKGDFTDIRIRTIEILKQYGIQAYWEETGKTRAKRYKLVMGSTALEATDESLHVTHEPPISQQHPAHLAGDNNAPVRKKAKRKRPTVTKKMQTVTLERRVDLPIPPSIVARNAAQQLADRRYQLLLDNLSTVGIPADDNGLNALQIAQSISKRFDISDINACRQLVSRLRNDGLVHSVGSQDGYVLLSLSPPISPKKKKRTTEANKSLTQETTQEEWSENDTKIAAIIARELLTLAHWQQGIEYGDIVSNISVYFPESKEQDIRRSIRRLCNAGYFETKETHKTGGPMSAKSHKFVIRFPSQNMKKQFKETPKTMKEEIELKILGL